MKKIIQTNLICILLSFLTYHVFGIGTITLTSPNGGQNWQAGSTYNITWTYTAPINSIDLQVTYDAGNTWDYIASPPVSQLSFSWTIPACKNSSLCKIKILGYYNPDPPVYDISENNFTIFPPPIGTLDITAPDGGETWYRGTTQTITWTKSGSFTLGFDLQYSANGGSSWNTIANGIPVSSTSYPWSIPTDIPSSNQYRIKIIGYYNCSLSTTNMSANNFTIKDPFITVTAPNGGETWAIGSQKNITWTSGGFTGNIKIEINGNYPSGVWETLFANISNDATEPWTVSGTPGSAKRIRITSVNNTNIYGISAANFSIAEINITAPNGGETWVVGNPQPITWTSAGFTGNVKIELNRNYPSGSWETLFSNTANDGTEQWTPTGTTGTANRIKVTSVNYTDVYDISTANFNIAGITVTAPNGGETWAIGSQKNITWTSGGFPGNIKIEINGNYPSGVWETLFANISNDATEPWTVSGTPGSAKRIRITSVNNTNIYGISAANFIITDAIIITAPIGGENWIIGTTKDITWTSTGITGNIKIEINGNYPTGSWEILYDNIMNDGIESWPVTGIPGDAKRIKISSVTNPLQNGISPNDFSINEYTGPSVYIYSPQPPITINLGGTVNFNIGANDPFGLNFSEWYIDNTFMENHDLSGYYADDSWNYTFNIPGTFIVSAYVYSTNNNTQNFVEWQITVNGGINIEHEFFDDFNYNNLQEAVDFNWKIRNYPGKPGFSNGQWSSEKISLVDDQNLQNNKLISLKAETQGTEQTTIQSEISSNYYFDQGTYACKVKFNNSPNIGQDGDAIVETFFTSSPYVVNDPIFSEIDFEYLPNSWQFNGNPEMDLNSWVQAAPDTNCNYQYPNSLNSWHILVLHVNDTEESFFIDNVLVKKHDNPDCNPNINMALFLQCWYEPSGLNTLNNSLREYEMQIDWIYHAKDEFFDQAGILKIVENFRNSDIINRNTMVSVLDANFYSNQKNISQGQTINFFDASIGNPTSWLWTFEGGEPSTWIGQTPPAIQYNTAGIWDVTLEISDEMTNDVELKSNYITVTLPEFYMTNGAVTTCTGYFYDSGGPNINYFNNAFLIETFYPSTPGSMIRFTFNSFITELGNDYLFIYNGENTSAPLIGTYSGSTGPGTVTASNVSGALTFMFYSNNSNVYAGWSASISCYSTTFPPVADFSASNIAPILAETVIFSDLSANYPTSWSWTFSPNIVTYVEGTSSTSQNPHVQFNALGAYTVSLTATNAYGSDNETKTDYINVNLEFNMANGTVTTCSGNFYDSGGSSGEYQNNEAIIETFYPSTPGAMIQFNFNTFIVETGWDNLFIYNGESTSAPLIGTYNGTISPGTVTASNAAGALTFRFTSDGSVVYTGWSASISCYSTTSPPVADFSASNTTPTLDETVNFTDLSTNIPTSWAWSFSPNTVTYVGSTSSTSQNPQVQFNSAGYYTVSLTATNTYGNDNETKTNYVNVINCEAPISTFPWTQDFENGGNNPTCWTQEYASGLLNWTYQNGGHSGHPTTAHGGTYNAILYLGSQTAHVTKLVSPALNLSLLLNPVLTFWHTQAFWSPDQDELRIYYKTSESGSWTLLETYTSDIPSWTQETINLPNKSSSYYIAFEGTAKFGYGVCIDDILVDGTILSPLNIDLTVFLEGPSDGTNMTQGLDGLIPLSQPYNIAPWNYDGTESVASIPANAVDWILVEFWDALSADQLSSGTLIEKKAVFLSNEGEVLDLNGNPTLILNGTVTNNLFVVVNHRNHLSILSADALVETEGVYTYNFTDASSKAYGGTFAQKEITPGIWGMIACDGNADGHVNLSDKTEVWKLQSGQSGYLSGDFNLDQQANNKDKNNLWINNVGRVNQIPGSGYFLCGDNLNDIRDGQSYKTVKIGNQCWMAENLNVGTMINGSIYQTQQTPEIIEKYCYDNNSTNCDTYGGLYQWSEMMQYDVQEGSKGICPEGWHIPAVNEWCMLTNFIDWTVDCDVYPDQGTDVGIKMKSTNGWGLNGNGTNSSGFTALPTGYLHPGASFIAQGSLTYYWSSTEGDNSYSWNQMLHSSIPYICLLWGDKPAGMSVRCIRNNHPPTQPDNPTPPNGAQNQPISTTLSWTCTDPNNDPLTYDVYFGTTNPPNLISNGQSSNTFNPGELEPGTTYYWKIVVHDNNSNATEGEVWSFETISLLEGLISYWKIDETSGTTVNDSYGSNNCTVGIGVTINQNGLIGKSAGFVDGNYGLITGKTASQLGIAGGSSKSVSIWIKPDPSIDLVNSHGIIDLGSEYDQQQFGIKLYGYWMFDSWYGAVRIGPDNDKLADGTWHHIVVTYNSDGHRLRTYLDGVFITEDTSKELNTGNARDFRIGRGSQGQFIGLIDEVGLWNRVLLDEEVQLLYYNGIGNSYPF
jgi:uncharacterized protein (TIGR02145 family)